MTTSNFELILEEWTANLKDMDRSAPSVEGNFEELMRALKQANATFDEARDILPKAVKAHLPPPGLARNTYKNLKQQGKMGETTEKEFVDSWNKDISDKGTSALYSVFPRPKAKDEDDDDPEPKVYGSMSVKEYRTQRRHAEQYPILNTEELERRVQTGTYNPEEDIARLLGKKDTDGSNK